ncbi:MAG: hypothetical protein HY343_12865 [Lentisphaerae bacterium]|nr:hypothetical protein [Lentisphaerota bacterium]
MDAKQRCRIAMTGGRPDRVPVLPQICPPHAIRAAGLPYRDTIVDRLRHPEKYDRLVADCAVNYGVDGFRVWMGSNAQLIEWRENAAYAIEPATGRPTGIVDFEGGGGVLTLPEKRRRLGNADIDALEIPALEALQDSEPLRPVRAAVETYGARLCIVGVPPTFTVETLCHTQGMEATLMDIVERPEFVRRWTERKAEISIRQAQAMARLGVDAFYIGETFGQFLSPEDFRALCLPYFQEFVSALRPTGKSIYLHMCGRITHLLDAIAETGVDCIEPLDELGGTRVREVKERLGGHMALMGGVRTDILAHGSLAEVEGDCRRCLREAAAGGGYILAAGDMLPTETDPAKVRAMVRIAAEEGRYAE